MTVIYNMSIDRADKPWIGDRRFTETAVRATTIETQPNPFNTRSTDLLVLDLVQYAVHSTVRVHSVPIFGLLQRFLLVKVHVYL